MKVFKDKYVEWLDDEINNTMSPSRKRALQDAKNKLQEIINEEYKKITEEKKNTPTI